MSGKKTGYLKKTRRLEGSHQKLAKNFLSVSIAPGSSTAARYSTA